MRAHHKNNKSKACSRKGYALVMCLLVIGVCSSIALTLFHLLRLQSAETHARQELTVARATLQAGQEHAIALLIDQPALRGNLGPYQAGSPDRTYALSLLDGAGGDVMIGVVATSSGASRSQTVTLSASDILDRRTALGL